MKTSIAAIAGIGMLVTPLLSMAQTDTHPTRAEVRAELVQLEKAGYHPGRRDDPRYPDDIQAAEARIAAQKQEGALSASGMGSGMGSTSQSGDNQASSTQYEHH